jgi:hypothetical protein
MYLTGQNNAELKIMPKNYTKTTVEVASVDSHVMSNKVNEN